MASGRGPSVTPARFIRINERERLTPYRLERLFQGVGTLNDASLLIMLGKKPGYLCNWRLGVVLRNLKDGERACVVREPGSEDPKRLWCSGQDHPGEAPEFPVLVDLVNGVFDKPGFVGFMLVDLGIPGSPIACAVKGPTGSVAAKCPGWGMFNGDRFNNRQVDYAVIGHVSGQHESLAIE